MKMTQTRIAEESSVYRGLDELQQHFLREEIRKDFRRSSATLRRIAKKKAIGQRIKWALDDLKMVTVITGFVAALVLSIIVIFYRG